MPNFDPLDAPLKERNNQPIKKKLDYIYSPRQMRLFKKWTWLVLVLNGMLYAVITGRYKMSEYGYVGLWMQFVIAIILGIVVGIAALFQYRHVPYSRRFRQWFIVYFLSVQCFVTLLLIVALVWG